MGKQIEEMTMDEYIKREDAISAVCFGCNLEFSDRHCEPPDCEIRHAINAVPSADVVEVVRCKDCKYNVANMQKDPLDTTDYSGDDIVCSYFMTDGMNPTDFCSYGERKE